MMRLQVNWQDAGGKDLGSATAGIEFIPVSSDWREEQRVLSCPDGELYRTGLRSRATRTRVGG